MHYGGILGAATHAAIRHAACSHVAVFLLLLFSSVCARRGHGHVFITCSYIIYYRTHHLRLLAACPALSTRAMIGRTIRACCITNMAQYHHVQSDRPHDIRAEGGESRVNGSHHQHKVTAVLIQSVAIDAPTINTVQAVYNMSQDHVRSVITSKVTTHIT